MTTSKQNGGLGIIDLEIHAQAMCAKFLVTLTTGQKSWAKMAFECLKLAKLKSQGGLWKGVGPFDKLLAPRWSILSFRGLIGKVLNKCKHVTNTLEWGDRVRYFENPTFHWSPWLSKLGITLESPQWREVARKLNNKGLI